MKSLKLVFQLWYPQLLSKFNRLYSLMDGTLKYSLLRIFPFLEWTPWILKILCFNNPPNKTQCTNNHKCINNNLCINNNSLCINNNPCISNNLCNNKIYRYKCKSKNDFLIFSYKFSIISNIYIFI